MTEDDKIDVSKKLSKASQWLLDELGRISISAADLVPRLYKSLENDGFGNSQIFRIIKEKIDISRSRLYELIPPESKRPYTKVQKSDNSIKEIDPEPELEFVVEKVDEYIAKIPREESEPPKAQTKSNIIKTIFDPAPIDRDRTQIFILYIDMNTGKIVKYEAVGRKSL